VTCHRFFVFSCSSDDEENLVDEGAEDFKPSEPQSKAEARGVNIISGSSFTVSKTESKFFRGSG